MGQIGQASATKSAAPASAAAANAVQPKATQHVVSAVTAIPDRAHPGRRCETNAIRDLQRHAASRIGYDFSRIPAHPRAASIQRKTLINTPGDRSEREADDVADQVMRMAEATTINA